MEGKCSNCRVPTLPGEVTYVVEMEVYVRLAYAEEHFSSGIYNRRVTTMKESSTLCELCYSEYMLPTVNWRRHQLQPGETSDAEPT